METEKRELTDNQLRLAQGAAGILCAAALMITIALSSSLEGLLAYLFVAVFVAITIGRRWVENKYRLRLNFFNLVMIDGIMAGLIVYVILILYFSEKPVQIPEIGKVLIVIGSCLILLLLGIGLPLLRYYKRKANGTVPPIRIPEKTEEEQEKENMNAQNSGQSSIARQIAEMTRELEEKDNQDK